MPKIKEEFKCYIVQDSKNPTKIHGAFPHNAQGKVSALKRAKKLRMGNFERAIVVEK
jgi:hypothetical protein